MAVQTSTAGVPDNSWALLYFNISRASSFWLQVLQIYGAYKTSQARACIMRSLGRTQQDVDAMWEKQHSWAGARMYTLCTSLRGFYIKVGQFLGARSDFIPEPICRKLILLQDKVPPMSPEQTRNIIEGELGDRRLEDAFAWVDLEQPLGSATIAQVHKATLKGASDGHSLQVAVKVQYPKALDVMLQDLGNIRLAASYLQDTEIKFDLVSPVDELAKQIRLEFDFENEARVMDTIAESLQAMEGEVAVPRSIPGLVTKAMLVMTYLEGQPITRMQAEAEKLPAWQQKMGKQLLLRRVGEAYGRMILGSGIFQADCHPGNILVNGSGLVGLVDFGQCKQLPRDAQLAFAELLVNLAAAQGAELNEVLSALSLPEQAAISASLTRLGIETGDGPTGTRVRLAYGMFDSRGRVDPFDKTSPLKSMPIRRFPSDLFFLLRVIQLLRGLSMAMGINDFSVALQWQPLAKRLLQTYGRLPAEIAAEGAWAWHGGFVPFGVSPEDVAWWDALRKPLFLRMHLAPELATAWGLVTILSAAALVAICCSGGIIHQARMVGLMLNHSMWQLAASWCLFRLKRLGLAAILSCCAAVLNLLTAASFAEVSRWAAVLVAPAAAGACMAGGLTLRIWQRNRSRGAAGGIMTPSVPARTVASSPVAAVAAQAALASGTCTAAQTTRRRSRIFARCSALCSPAACPHPSPWLSASVPSRQHLLATRVQARQQSAACHPARVCSLQRPGSKSCRLSAGLCHAMHAASRQSLLHASLRRTLPV